MYWLATPEDQTENSFIRRFSPPLLDGEFSPAHDGLHRDHRL